MANNPCKRKHFLPKTFGPDAWQSQFDPLKLAEECCSLFAKSMLFIKPQDEEFYDSIFMDFAEQNVPGLFSSSVFYSPDKDMYTIQVILMVDGQKYVTQKHITKEVILNNWTQ